MRQRTPESISTKKLTLQYCILLALYWSTVFCTTGFASELLLARGFDNSKIGMLIAAGNILAVIAQPLVASIADKSKKVKVHHLIIILSLILLVAFIVLVFCGNKFWAVAIPFVISVLMVQVLQPLTNSISVYYVNKGVSINFGVSRAIGSLAYAVISLGMGILTDRFSEDVDLFVGIAITAFLLLITFSLPIIKENRESQAAENSAPEKGSDGTEETEASGNFLKKYPLFVLMLVGIALLFSFHVFFNNFLIQILEPIGGNHTVKGIALAIAAVAELPTMIFFSFLSKKFGSRKLLIFGTVFFCIKAAATALITTAWQIYPVMVLQMISYAIYIPACVEYVNEIMEEQDKYKGQAFSVASNTAGGIIANLLGGILIDRIGVRATNFTFMGICILGAVIVIATLIWGSGKQAKNLPQVKENETK